MHGPSSEAQALALELFPPDDGPGGVAPLPGGIMKTVRFPLLALVFLVPAFGRGLAPTKVERAESEARPLTLEIHAVWNPPNSLNFGNTPH